MLVRSRDKGLVNEYKIIVLKLLYIEKVDEIDIPYK
jgi:hypothetical protein